MQPTDPHLAERVPAAWARPSERAAACRPRRAFTLVEILFVVGIIGLLISLLLPAIQASREKARRHSCANNFAQLAIATHHYAAVHRVLPPGTIEASGPIQSRPVGYHLGWVPQLLPFIEQGTAYDQIDFLVGAYHAKNAPMRRLKLALLQCPSDSGGWTSWKHSVGCNYAGCHHNLESPIDIDNHGVMFLNSVVGWDDISDGRAQTILLGEKLQRGFELGWISGTRSTLRNTGTPINRSGGGVLLGLTTAGPLDYVVDLGAVGSPKPAVEKQVLAAEYGRRAAWNFQGNDSFDSSEPEHEYQPPALSNGTPGALVVGGFESQHVTGAQFAFGDGSVRFLSEDVDIVTYRRMGHRCDGELLDARF